MKENNLVMFTLLNGFLIIGRKYGSLIKNPRQLVITEKLPDGKIRFQIAGLLFGPEEIHTEGLSGFWQIIDNKQVMDMYLRTTTEIIIPESNIIKMQ